MTEVNTYSAAVDDVVTRSGRPNMIPTIVSYIRQTMRECQMRAFFRRDMTEDTLTATASPFVWTEPSLMRQLRTVRYNIFDRQGNYIWPKFIRPGEKQKNEIYYYYGGLDYFVFSGIDANVQLDIAYYSYFKKLPYYALAARPATFSLENDTWSYLTATTSADQLAARQLVTNWMLEAWYDLIIEGALAKIFKTIDDTRARSSFALYKSLQTDLLKGEAWESVDM